MSVNLFGVTAAIVRADYFPQIADFSTDSNPTVASVNRYLDQRAATLEARLLQESVVASAITIATDAAYLWCQQTLTLMVAIRVMEAMSQQDAELLKRWREELLERWAELEEKGYLALGGGVSTPDENPDGPTHHISNLGLDTSRVAESASSIDMPFHKDDNT